MGGSCSKMDGAQHKQTSEQAHTNNNAFVAEPTIVRDMPPLPASKKRRTQRKSIFRVGSRRSPASPTRASTYDHVTHTVNLNLREAESERKNINSPMGVIGLRNLGNTCFLNSSLQCLSATIPLTDYFLGYDYRSEINTDNVLGTQGALVTAYATLMKEIWLGNSTVVKPSPFKSQLEQFAPQFRGTHQQDAQELLAFLLDGIHEDLNRIKKKPYIEDRDCDGTSDEQDAIEAWKNYLTRDKSLIVDIFQGQLRNTLVCLSCNHKNIRFEPFMYLSLPITDSCTSLRDCLELYLHQEELRGDNQWYCPKCKQHRDATKKTDLWILPPILIVHLKRFKFNEYGDVGSKNNAAIDYPLRGLDLSDCVKSAGSEYPLYDLYAVSNHVGNLGGGHYTAYAMNRFGDNWYEFNDSSFREVSENTMMGNRSSAYLLFYNRTSKLRSEDSMDKRTPLVRRQSVSRPDLWPHTQVEDRQFRAFTRSSIRIKIPKLPRTEEETSAPQEDIEMEKMPSTGLVE